MATADPSLGESMRRDQGGALPPQPMQIADRSGISGFDPDEFLRSGGKTTFDPDEFLRSTKNQPTIPSKLPPRTPPKEEQRTIGERVGQGFMDPVYGAAQLGARLDSDVAEGGLIPPLPAEEREKRIEAIDQQVREREANISKRAGQGIDWWRMVGNAANPINYGLALIGGLPGAAAAGLMAGLTQPVTDPTDYFDKKMQDAAFSTAFGFGGGAVTHVAGAAVSPVVGNAARQLVNRGVDLTPGRLAGQLMSSAEDASRSIPWLGWFIKNAAQRSMGSYNIGVVNTVLTELGVPPIPRQIRPGRDAVDYLHQQMTDAYEQIVNAPGLQLLPDHQFITDMQRIRAFANGLGGGLPNTYDQRVNQALGMRLLGGSMNGREFKMAEDEIGKLASTWGSSSLASERELGDAFSEVQSAMRAALQRQNPQVAEQLDRVNTAYAMFKRIQAASARRVGAGKEEGVFTPTDLAGGVRKLDTTKDKSAFARGDALLQDWAEWGQFVLPQRVPDSGTTERALWAMLGLGAGTIGIPATIGLAAKGSLAAIPYIPPVMRGINWVVRGGPRRQAFRRGTETARPFVGGAAGSGEEVFRFDDQGNRQ
jgi:hypothetical protein